MSPYIPAAALRALSNTAPPMTRTNAGSTHVSEDDPWRWPSPRAGLLSTILVALCCGLAAFFSESLCDTDGTFSLESPLARPSDCCRATHFPGFPDTFGSALAVSAVYVMPVMIAAVGWLAAATGKRRLGVGALRAAIVLAAAAMVLSIAASDVRYVGVG